MLYKLYSSGGAWLEERTLHNALQHVRREGRCEEVREANNMGDPRQRCGMVLGGVWGCTVSWMVLGDHVFPDFFTPAFTANVL